MGANRPVSNGRPVRRSLGLTPATTCPKCGQDNRIKRAQWQPKGDRRCRNCVRLQNREYSRKWMQRRRDEEKNFRGWREDQFLPEAARGREIGGVE